LAATAIPSTGSNEEKILNNCYRPPAGCQSIFACVDLSIWEWAQLENLTTLVMGVEIMQKIGPSAIEMAIEKFGDSSAPPVFLIMGGGAQMISWPDGFCRELANRELHLIRFDNRDVGLSTHFTDAPEPDFLAVMTGDFSTASYSLSDMAADVIGLMDALQFDAVHLVGASMGGMIAQTIAIEFPSRVKSLTSIMSTTGNPAVGKTDFGVLSQLGVPPWNDRERYVNWRVKTLKVLGSPGFPFDEKAATESAELSWDRDHDPLGLTRQAAAVLKSGDRTERLRHLNVPTLVIHGKSDIMIDVSGGIATADTIPNAKLALFDGMGHSLPQPLGTEIVNLIAAHVKQAELVTAI